MRLITSKLIFAPSKRKVNRFKPKVSLTITRVRSWMFGP